MLRLSPSRGACALLVLLQFSGCGGTPPPPAPTGQAFADTAKLAEPAKDPAKKAK